MAGHPKSKLGHRSLLRRLYWAFTPAVHGRSRPRGIVDISAAVPFASDIAIAAVPRVCVVCHLFYDDLAGEMSDILCRIPFAFDTFISTSDVIKAARIRAAFRDLDTGTVEVRVAPNRGRDIAPKLVTFSDVYASYDIVLFMHGKKSVTSVVGQRWSETLIDGLIGSGQAAQDIVAMMMRHPEIGIVMTQHFEPIRPHLHWDHSFGRARALARRMGFDLTRRHVVDMPSGSMFWARTAAIAPLLSLELQFEDFPEETGQRRRTLHHTIERLFLYVAERAGFQWIKVAAPRHYDTTSDIRTITNVAELDAFVAEAASFDLMTSDRRS